MRVCVCVCVCVCLLSISSPYLVEPEVVRLQKSLKFGEKLLVVKGVDGFHVTRTVIQITCYLSTTN